MREIDVRKILFVCTGNTCRSSMAEGIAKKGVGEKGMDREIEISSAGIWAVPGDEASPQAVEAMKECGINLAGHRARRIDVKLIEDADIILAMTESHKRNLLSICPYAKHKIFTLKEYVGGEGDIKDPFGGSVEVYKECAKELKEYIDKAIDKIDKGGL